MNSCDWLVDENSNNSIPVAIECVNEQASAVIWIFSGHELDDNAVLYVSLYAMFDSVQTYKDTEMKDCIEFIRAYKNTECVVIVSMNFALSIIPHIHDLRQLDSIYIYDLYNSIENARLYTYTKIMGVHKTIDHLFNHLQNTIQRQNFSVLIRDESTVLIYSKIDLLAKIFSKVLIQLEYNQEKARKIFVNKCRSCYSGNKTILKDLEELEHSYDRSKALHWYTRGSFLFRLVNKALRTMNIEVIFMCHFIIVDICKALEEQHAQSINKNEHPLSHTSVVQVYRGQRMRYNELDQLMLSLHEFIIVKSFLSATYNPEVALMFGGSHSDGNKCQDIFVLFTITIDMKAKHTPFASIKKESAHEDEDEVLFMMCSLFLIENITYDKNKYVWVINMSLTDENDQRLLDRLDQLDCRHLSELSFATQIIETGNFIRQRYSQRLSSLYYNNLLRDYSTDDPICECACYSGLGWNAFLQGNHELAFADQEKALERCLSNADKRSKGLKATILNYMGEIYEAFGLFELALQSYTKAALDLDSFRLDQYDAFSGFQIIPTREIAKWHRIQRNFDVAMEIYDKIIETKKLNHMNGRMSLYREIARAGGNVLNENDVSTYMICWKNFVDFSSVHYRPKYHNEIAHEYYFIGNKILEYKTSFSFNRTDLVLECYRKSIDIFLHYAPKEHQTIAECYGSMAKIYVTIGSNQSHLAAIEHYEKAVANIPSDTSHALLIDLLSSYSKEVADVYVVAGQFNLAIERLLKAVEYDRRYLHVTMDMNKPYYEIVAAYTNEKISMCYSKIADIYEMLASKYRNKSLTDLEPMKGIHDSLIAKLITEPIAVEPQLFDKRIIHILLSAQPAVKATKIFKCLHDHELALCERKEHGYQCDKCHTHFQFGVPSWCCTENDYYKCCRCLATEINYFNCKLLEEI